MEPFLLHIRPPFHMRANLQSNSLAIRLTSSLLALLWFVSASRAADSHYACSNGESHTLGELERFLRDNRKGIFEPDQMKSCRGKLVLALSTNADELIKALKWMNDFPAKPAGEVFKGGL